MLKYYAQKDNYVNVFTGEERAKKFCEENPGYELAPVRAWKYYDRNLKNSTTRYTDIKGETLQEAISNNIDKILKSMGQYGVSGYTLVSAKLIREEGKVYFVVESYPFSDALVGYSESMKNKENLKIEKLEILEVTDDELPESGYVFKLNK